jgi:4-alpha-glucanotransferase
VQVLVNVLGKRPEELKDFIEMYENTYMEKEKLWGHMGFSGQMKEASDKAMVESALGITMRSASVFCINLINDLLYLDDLFGGDPYRYRVNTPGTVNPSNWSMTIPLSLEKLLKSALSKNIKKMVSASSRL